MPLHRLGQSRLVGLDVSLSFNFGVDGLPEELFEGLTSLSDLQLINCRFQNLPSLNDLTVCTATWFISACMLCRLSHSPSRAWL